MFALGAAYSTVLGREWVGTLLADCQPSATGAGILRVRVADFPALAAANGSVRLALNAFTLTGPSGAYYPVLINRGTGTRFYALSTQCRHQGCVIPTFSAAVGASVCGCHGSRYALNGSVLAGPATQSLFQYPVSFDGTTLCVEMPNLGYTVTTAVVSSGAVARLSLSFGTFRGGSYQVRLYTSAATAGAVVPFATTLTGAATVTALTGTGTPATVYVDRTATAGFYTVQARATAG
jgi:nitrite reductase/ring-hydroxylating ferredoxin subunit